jgi:hypothetical protein
MKAMADPHELSIPPAAWVRLAGQLAPDAQAPWGQSVRAAAGQAGPLVETEEYLLDPGEATLTIAASLAAPVGGAPKQVGSLDLVDARSNELMASAPLALVDSAGAYQRVTLTLPVTGGRIRRTRVRVHTTGQAGWTLGDIAVAARYGWEVIDLAEPLNGFNTHASAFDAHPNRAAHRIIAEHVYRRLAAR